MTRYKKYMKEKHNIEFSEDLEFLPYPVGNGNIVLEDIDVFSTCKGLMVVSTYNVDVARTLYLPDGTIQGVYE